jgi:hypothetical protein
MGWTDNDPVRLPMISAIKEFFYRELTMGCPDNDPEPMISAIKEFFLMFIVSWFALFIAYLVFLLMTIPVNRAFGWQ